MDTRHDAAAIAAEVNERGYCFIPGVISPQKADEARRKLERLLADEMTDEIRAAKTQRVGGIAYKDPIFAELLAHPFIVSIWQSYLADVAVICFHLVGQYRLSGLREIWLASGLSLLVDQPALAAGQGLRADDMAARRLHRGKRRHRLYARQPLERM